MADLYQHDSHKFADAGLQLRVPPDLVPPNQYARITNGTPIIEGRIEGRAGLKFIANFANTTNPGSGLHSLTRLNQPVNYTGDRIAGIDTAFVTFALPAGSAPVTPSLYNIGAPFLTGDPLTLPTFHYASDSAAWQIVAHRNWVYKYRSGLLQNLGIATPQDLPTGGVNNGAATAADAGAGNLNNGSGPGYDWVYTWVNTKTQSESNPSVANFGANAENKSPTAVVTPDPGFGGLAADASGATTATLTSNTAAEKRESVLWKSWASPTQQYQQLQLMIQFSFTPSLGTGCLYSAIYFSLDGGSSWKSFWDSSQSPLNPANYVFIANLPINQDITLLQVRAVTFGIGNTTTPQNVIARRIRDRGSNFNVNDLLTGGGGNVAATLRIFNIVTQGVFVGAAVSTLPLANRQANVCVVNPTLYDQQVDAIRLYRRGGAVTAGWAFVSQSTVASLGAGACGSNRLQINDNIADANLGSFVLLTNDAPVSSVYMLQRQLPYMWGPCFNPARLLGCGDQERPGSIYFSNPGNADQWASFNFIDVSSPSDPMQNGCLYNTRVFAFSKERMYEIIQGLLGGSTLQPFETPCRRGLISPWGLVSTARAVYFVAKDGIYSTDGGVEQSLVENNIKPLFPTLDTPVGRQVESYDAVNMERIEDIRLRFHNDELYFSYRGLNSGNLQTLVYDQNKDRWRAASYPVAITTVYSEEAGPASSLLLGDSTGNMYSTASGTGDALQNSTPDISVEIRTGAFDQGISLNQKEYGNVLVDIDPGGATVAKPVTITPFLNGEVITGAAVTVTGTGRQQVPLSLGDVFGFNLSFGITFSKNSTINPVLFQFDILYRLEPVQVSHFETRELSYGMPGFGHARDAYVAVRSTSPITLTMTFDGTVQTYTIPSTSNLRRKTYLPFNSNKGKLYRFSLDTSDGSGFRIYQEDSEIRFKPWITSLGYQVTRALGAEAPMVTQAFESQLLGGR